MKIAVTGASGFVGRQVCRRLAVAGHELYLYDLRHPDPPSGSHVFPIPGNLATGEGLEVVPWAEVDRVLHLAAAGVKASRRTWMECLQVNVTGTQRLIECLRKCDCPPHLVYARTFYENHLNLQAVAENPYVATKKAGSDLIGLYRQQTNAPVTSVTLYQVFGPGDDAGNVLSYIVRQLRSNKPAQLGSGLGKRDWIYIDDLVDGIAASLEAPIGDYDIGSGQLYSLRHVAEQIAQLMGISPEALEFDAKRDRGDTEIVDCAEKFARAPDQLLPLQQRLAEFIRIETANSG